MTDATDYQQLADGFHRRIDCIAGAVDALAPGIDAGARQIVSAVLADQRILLCGSPRDSALAHYATLLLRRPGDSLPALPAIHFDSAGQGVEQLWQDVRCLSRDGDLLVCFDSSDAGDTALGAAALAAQRNLLPVLFSVATDPQGGSLPITLQAADSELRRELALMAFHELRGRVLRLLMGE